MLDLQKITNNDNARTRVYITINIGFGYNSTRILASAEENEDPYRYLGLDIRQIKFHHNPHKSALDMIFNSSSGQIYHNDQSITFKSNTPFKEFCKGLKQSEFNDPHKFSLRTHNCAYAAKFALQLANINIDAPNYVIFNKLGAIFPYFIPAFSLSPTDLYHQARSYKIKTTHLSFQQEIATSALSFWNKKLGDEKQRTIVNNISKDLVQSSKDRPEHTDFYLRTLIETLDLILQLPTEKACENYKAAGRFFQTRTFFSFDNYVKLHTLIAIAGCAVDLLGRSSMLTNLGALALEVSSMAYYFYHLRNKSGVSIEATPLSSQMESLANKRLSDLPSLTFNK